MRPSGVARTRIVRVCFSFSLRNTFSIASASLIARRSSGVSDAQEGLPVQFVEHKCKRVLLIAAAILTARKLAQYDAGKRVPATMCAISDAVCWAEEILKEIDERWPGEAIDGAD
jgi:hypothetical protein